MAEPSSAPVLPDPAWIVGKHALMNVRATSRRGRTEIDPLLGHTQVQTTARYAHLADDPVKSAANRIASRIADVIG